MSDIDHVNLLREGQRQLIVGDIEGALKSLSEACRKIAADKGDTSDDLFEPYLYYGKALYAYHKVSSDIIGDGMPEIPGENSNNESVQLQSVNEERPSEVEGSSTINGESKHLNVNDEGESTNLEEDEENESTDDEQVDEEEGVEGVKEGHKDKEEEAEKEGNKEETGKEEDDEDVGYLHLSYENVECAKLIIKRQLEKGIIEEKVLDFKMADCCDVTGDIYIEEEVMEEAIAQYQTALDLRMKHLEPSDRMIAESHYKIAMAYNIDYRVKEAKESFEKCRDILKIHRDEAVKKKEDPSELDDILVEIEEKIIECEESEKECERAKESLRQFMSVTTQALLPAVSSDISHLVKKRKLPIDNSLNDDIVIKKSKEEKKEEDKTAP